MVCTGNVESISALLKFTEKPMSYLQCSDLLEMSYFHGNNYWIFLSQLEILSLMEIPALMKILTILKLTDCTGNAKILWKFLALLENPGFNENASFTGNSRLYLDILSLTVNSRLYW